MSKDIWHEPTETPTEHKTLLFDSIEFDETEMGVYSGGLFHSYNEFEPMTPAGLSRWAYLSDFINCQKELIRTRKALEGARHFLKEIRLRYLFEKDEPSRQNKWWDTALYMYNCAESFFDDYDITALEQKDK